MQRKRDFAIFLTLCILGFSISAFSSEFDNVSIVNYRILLDGNFVDKTLDDPLFSYNDKTYLSIRDAGKLFHKDVKWTESAELITLSEKKPEKLFVATGQTALTIGKTLAEEHFPDRICSNTRYAVSKMSNEIAGGDTEYSVYVVFDGQGHSEDEIEYIHENVDIKISMFQKAWKVSLEELK